MSCILFFLSFCLLSVSVLVMFFFFFKQKTAYEMRISDWSSDVCSSDLSGRISKQRLERLAVAIKEVLSAAILAGGSTLRDYARPDGELGYFSKQWRVYGREGAACLCGAVIRRRTDSGRSTFYCPKCQR